MIYYRQWCNSQGAECLPDTSHWEIFDDLLGKERQRNKGENGEEKKKNQKRVGGLLKMEGGKVKNEERTFFFFFFFFLLFTFQNH